MTLFWKHLEMMKSASGYITKFQYGSLDDIQDFQTLIDSTSPLTRSIPNESLLASMQGRIGNHYQNPRLHQRMITDGCNELDYPDVTEETKYYWCFDISILVEVSPLIKSLVLHGQDGDSTKMNTLINQYYEGQIR